MCTSFDMYSLYKKNCILNLFIIHRSLLVFFLQYHCPESRFLCSGTQGWIPSMLRVDSEQWQQAVFTNHFVKCFPYN